MVQAITLIWGLAVICLCVCGCWYFIAAAKTEKENRMLNIIYFLKTLDTYGKKEVRCEAEREPFD